MPKLSLPPVGLMAAAAAEMVARAAAAGATSRVNALNKAALHLDHGIEITLTVGGALIPSGTRAGIVHRISTINGCSCERGRQGGACWHSALVEIIEEAQIHYRPAPSDRPTVAQLLAAARARVEMDELFS